MADFAASAGMELFYVGKFGIFGTRTPGVESKFAPSVTKGSMPGSDGAGNAIARSFGGIFSTVPEGDVEGTKRSSELFEERLALAQGQLRPWLLCCACTQLRALTPEASDHSHYCGVIACSAARRRTRGV